VRPFSQSVFYDKKKRIPIWRIGLLSDMAYEKIFQPLLRKNRTLFLQKKQYAITLDNIRIVNEISYENLQDSCFVNDDLCRGVEVSFLTTTSFKHDNKYVIFPKLILIIKSLINRWNLFSPIYHLPSKELDEMLVNECVIRKYNLHSQLFSVESKEIYGFSGTMMIRFSDNELANRILTLLMRFSLFSGIGIKTALGMGAVHNKIIY
jgi:CRISPR-associated endoribonuclease Cas6